MVRRFTAAILSLILAMAIPAQSSVPKGWFLHEDQAPTLTLAYYDPSSGDVMFAVTCTQGYTDAVIAFYPETASPGKKAVRLTLSSGDSVLVIDGTAQIHNGRYAIDGQTSIEQHLVDLLHGGFTLASDGQEMRTFSTTEQDAVHVRNLTKACRG
ncbi:hypothetical protein KYK30_30710 [Shinella yambaruensis]|uniref:Uncharacterized protein n=1 Tax=Shinella yambaruensis TaxID=415996 RepID=A0ABQ5ZFX2_9HYPH|nr:hypothetical protein [Shinella yambaruensis]MCJ8029370.1 hypothetical protein [Shinella yambaruensis]MCU7984093.1 hypothetical protein [Shinella yambaruensis]GLR50659.1 hypothetical protein GCM10007923_18660 [Shinella yambaruensis]